MEKSNQPAQARDDKTLIEALAKQTIAINGFTAAVAALAIRHVELVKVIRDLLETEEIEESQEPRTYLNGDPLER